MRVLIAFDKFKHALTAMQACEAAANALRERHSGWVLDLCPLTDGGDGFCESLTRAAAGRFEPEVVRGPRGRCTRAEIGLVDWNRIPAAARGRLAGKPGQARETVAVVELAAASGVALLSRTMRDPWRTSTFGTGELIRTGIAREAGSLLLGIGGSATNDLGLGALAALGFTFRDARGGAVAIPTPFTWPRIRTIETGPSLPPTFIACDVTNPLLGPQGATATYGPQKGLKPGDLPRLEAQMARMAELLCRSCGRPLSLAEVPGTGAAGGIGFGLMVACGARLVPGFELVSDWLDLGPRLARADLVITGEGRFDSTSLTGKGPGTLVAEAKRLGKPAHVFAGSLGVPEDRYMHAITPASMRLAEALPRTAGMLAASVSAAL